MKKILVIIVTLLCLYGQTEAGISKIVGTRIDCGAGCTTFPATASLLCQGSSCPQYFHPDWTDTTFNRFYGIKNDTNPGTCVVSFNGGSVWVPCTTQPFTSSVLNTGIKFAVASDGSLLAASGQGSNTCIIRRSTNQAASWTTVFTSTTQTCSLLFGFPTPPEMYCAELNGYCAIINSINPSVITVIYSIDNGANWTVGTGYSHISADSRTWGPILTTDGIGGSIIRGVNTLSGEPFGIKSGNDFVSTGNYVPSTNQNCRPFLMGSNLRALCTRNGISDPVLRYVAVQIPPIEIRTVSTGISPAAQNIQPVGFSANIGYVVLVDAADTTRLKILASIDDFVSTVLLTTLTPTVPPILFCCNGNAIKWGSRLYFSSGSAGSTGFFGVIQ